MRKKVLNVNDVMNAVNKAEFDAKSVQVKYKYQIAMPADSQRNRDDLMEQLSPSLMSKNLSKKLPTLKFKYTTLDSNTIEEMSNRELLDFISHFEVKCIEMYNHGVLNTENFEGVMNQWLDDIWAKATNPDTAYYTSYVLIQVYNNEILPENEKGYILGIILNNFGNLGGVNGAKLQEFYVANLDYEASYNILVKYLEEFYNKVDMKILAKSTYKKTSHMRMGTDEISIYLENY